jgi:hypothetical protein
MVTPPVQPISDRFSSGGDGAAEKENMSAAIGIVRALNRD